ncbi:MAG: rhodanese-related sulfurtransferase [Leptolyngbyaceae cyanobacterium SU_3_3]|nr:rhodanese-related sulfurtransferase [Leptolyngbyaceae cyanobacterium SU_3_3]
MSFSDSYSIPEVDVETLAHRLQEDLGALRLIDVREVQEIEIAQVPGFTHLPLSDFSTWSRRLLDEWALEDEIWVICHHGMRSAQVCAWLSQQGYQNVKNVVGGIDAYSLRVDQTIPRY